MIVTAWNNGAHCSSGAGYGLKIDINDRDRYFRKEWDQVILELDGRVDSVAVNIRKPSFWSNHCREVISKDLGKWLREQNKAPWPRWKPPKMIMEPIADSRFSVRFLYSK